MSAVSVRWRKSGTVAAFTMPGDPWWSLERDWHVRAHLNGCVCILDYQGMAAAGDMPGATYNNNNTITFTGEALAALRDSELAAVARLEAQGTRDAARLFEIAEAHGGRLPADVVFETCPRTMPLFGGGGGDTFDVLVWERLQRAQDAGRWHSPHDALGLCVERLGYQIGWRDDFMPCSTAQLVPLEGPRVDWLGESRAYWQGVK